MSSTADCSSISQERRKKLAVSQLKSIAKDIWNFVFILELYLGPTITETFDVPKSINFLRSHVSKNVPLVIRGAMSESPAVKKWNSNHFR